jgi:histidyl-tRNA synthetase
VNEFMVPEKGRNSQLALDRELREYPINADWISSITNDRGKHAAKTGVDYEAVAEQVADIDILDLKYTDRLKKRPVFRELEFTDKRIVGYESIKEAWVQGSSRFYAGLDEVLEELLASGVDVDLREGFEAAVVDELFERGYELADVIGDEVKWAAMGSGSSPDEGVTDRPAKVLVPGAFEHLGRALAALYWDEPGVFDTFANYAESRGTPGMDEEQLLAESPPGVVGIYMYVSGSTAAEYGLAFEPIEGAISRLGIFNNHNAHRDSMVELSSLKGMYDRYPEEFAAFRTVIDTVEATAREFGFREIDTPSIERTELYRVKSGDELLDQTYNFSDKGDREVTLVPEQTPTRARLIQKRKNLRTPVKWFDTSKRWRYEQVQKGRDREFLQTDIDIFGVESAEADAEVIACAATIFRKFDVDHRVNFLINDRNLLESLLEAHDVTNTTEVMKVIDKKEKMEPEEFLRSLEHRGLSRETAVEVDELTEIQGPIAETVDELSEKAPDDDRTAAAVERVHELSDALESYGVEDMCLLDLSIVRGLAYYTGVVFEAFDVDGELRSLFGGGRYDDLVGLFGEQEMPAVGFAFGYSPTYWLLKEAGKWPDEEVETDVYVLPVSSDVRPTAREFTMQLRNRGLTTEIDLLGRGVGDQFSYADATNATWVVVVGERDLDEGVVTVRNMHTGEEELVEVDEVVDELESRLAG